MTNTERGWPYELPTKPFAIRYAYCSFATLMMSIADADRIGTRHELVRGRDVLDDVAGHVLVVVGAGAQARAVLQEAGERERPSRNVTPLFAVQVCA